MQHKKLLFLLIGAGALLLALSAIGFFSTQTVNAQCGSQASSCKNCHEVQGKDPVNNDGKSWHQAHAFGDFCYICHGGNQQATDETAAHQGMVAPLSDVQAACAQCHPDDLQARAQVYASALGAELGTGTSATPVAASNPGTSSAGAQPNTVQLAAVDPGDPSIVNYVKLYNQDVLGEGTTNWGNVILLILIGAMVIGGGGLILRREGLVKVMFHEVRPVEGEYPEDVVDMVPAIASLKPSARKVLRRLVERPDEMSRVWKTMQEPPVAGEQHPEEEESDLEEGN